MIGPARDPTVPARRAPNWRAVVIGVILLGAALAAAAALPQLLKPAAGDPSGSPSLPASMSAEPTIAPRADWSYHHFTDEPAYVNDIAEIRGRLYLWGSAADEAAFWVSDDGAGWKQVELPPSAKGGLSPISRWVEGMAELRGRLYAWGTAGQWEADFEPTQHSARFYQPAIWVSDDGASWTATEFPEVHMENAHLHVIDAGDRLVALVVGGWEIVDDTSWQPTSTVIYASPDGETWQRVAETPGIDAGAHHTLLKVGGRLLAVGGGKDIWGSNDGGLSWSVSTTADQLHGWMDTAVQRDGLIVGWGYVQEQQTFGPSLLWASVDGGNTWTRRELSAETSFGSPLFGPDGQILIMERAPQLSFFYGTEVPGGYAALGWRFPERTDETFVLTSPDAMAWTEHKIDMRPESITWTPTFGIVVLGDRNETTDMLIGLGPQPFP